MAAIWAIGNPRGKKRRGGKKRRSAAQRRATAAMLAANGRVKRRSKRGGRKAKRRGRRRSGAVSVSAPRRSYRRSRRSSGRGASLSTGSAISLLKAGAIGGAGAVLVDVGMGQAAKLLASAVPSLSTPANADGSPNYGYYGVKAGLAIALGTIGKRFIPAPIADRMAEGALTVLAYQFMRPLVPAGLALGNFNPAPTMRRVAGVNRVGAYVSGAGAYQSVPIRSNGGTRRGANAANVVAMVSR